MLRRGWLASLFLIASVSTCASACTNDDSEAERRSGVELMETGDAIQLDLGSLASVTSLDEIGVVLIIAGEDAPLVEVVDQACAAMLRDQAGPPFAYIVTKSTGEVRWYGSSDRLEGCPPR